MSSRNVLVVAFDKISEDDVRRAIETRQQVADVSVLVVAPAAGVGPLRWLTGDEDEARAEAAEVAGRAAEALDADEAIDAEVHTEVGDSDPLLAVEDALRSFPADEIVVAGRPGDDTEAALRRLHLPISHLDGADAVTAEEESGAEAVAREVTRGRGSYTPVVLLALVLGVIATAIAVILLIAYLVVWLV
jgi:hypothetical protein